MEEVQPAVVVEINEVNSPADVLRIDGQAGRGGQVVEELTLHIAIEDRRIVAEVGEEEVEVAVTVIISHGDAHIGLLLAVAIHRHPGFHGAFREGPIMIVAEQQVGRGVAGHEQVGPGVVVVVKRHRRQTVASAGLQQAGFFGDVRKGAVAIVVVERANLFLQPQRATIDGYTSVQAIAAGATHGGGRHVHVDVVRNE